MNNSEKIVLIGTAPNEYLINAFNALTKKGYKVIPIVKKDRIDVIKPVIACSRVFRSDISWWHFSLLRLIRSLHPDLIALVIGDQFHHENVTFALKLWKRLGLLGEAKIYASLSTDPANLEYWGGDIPINGYRYYRTLNNSRWKNLALPYLSDDPVNTWKNNRIETHVTVTSPDGVYRSWTLHIDSDGARRTSPEKKSENLKQTVVLLGGDFTFGAGLADEETFAWILESEFPSVSFRNYATVGYDLLQIERALKRVLENSSPEMAIIEVSKQVVGVSAQSGDIFRRIISNFTESQIKPVVAPIDNYSRSWVETILGNDPDNISISDPIDTGNQISPCSHRKAANTLADYVSGHFDVHRIEVNDLSNSFEKREPATPACGQAQKQISFHLINYVWGSDFIRLYLDVTLPNHTAAGKLSSFAQESNSIYKVYTTRKDAEVIKAHPAFKHIELLMPTEIVTMDHLFSEGWEKRNNSLLIMTQMHRVAINSANLADARLVILPPDQIYSDGVFEKIIEHAKRGKRAVMINGIRVVKETFVPALNKTIKVYGNTILQPPKLLKLAFENLHPITQSEFFDAHPFSSGPVNLYKSVEDEGFVTHNLHMHVLMVHPKCHVPLKEGNFDTTWLAASCPDFSDYHVVNDSDEMVAVEISDANKRVGMNGGGPIDKKRLARFYKKNGTHIHWELLQIPVLLHTCKLNDKWDVTQKFTKSFVRSTLPISRRVASYFKAHRRY